MGGGIATLGGAAIGVERQWSGHASGPEARFAGVRTFTMLGALAGLAGLLWTWGAPMAAVAVLGGEAALAVAGYVAASRRDVDGTTEVAALVVIGAGAAAGLGHEAVASGVIALTWLLLSEKSRLHAVVHRLDAAGLTAAARFAVMAAVVLPLLPEGPFGPLGGLRPRQLWMAVLFFSGLGFAGYVARILMGASRGYAVAGLMGGLVSSTNVTLSFARLSRENPDLSGGLAQGAVAANAVLYPRVLAALAVLNPPLALALLPWFAAPFLAGAAVVAVGWWRAPAREVELEAEDNPLQLRHSLVLALVFQLVLYGMAWVQSAFGDRGVVSTAGLLGMTDVDALTLSMAQGVETGRLALDVAAAALATGILINTLVKLSMTAAIGRGRFRQVTAAVLGVMAAGLGAAIVLALRA